MPQSGSALRPFAFVTADNSDGSSVCAGPGVVRLSEKIPVQRPAPSGGSPSDELAALRARIRECQEMGRELRAELLRLQERAEIEKTREAMEAVETFARDLLLILDGVASALRGPPASSDDLRAVEKRLQGVLRKHRIFPIETEGRGFDPAYHEALAVEEAKGRPDGTILEVLRTGWTIGGRVLRSAGVRVAKTAFPFPPKS